MAPRRILVYGVTGSGKTTLARRISEKTGLPFIDVDELTWLPGWVEVSAEEQVAIISQIVAKDEWVMDTAYGKWSHIVLPRAELIVGLDYPRWLSLGRLLRRTFLRALLKTPACNGNYERWSNLWRRDSIVSWHFNSWARKRERIRGWKEKGTPETILFRQPRDAEEWLDTLRDAQNSVPPQPRR